MKYEDFINNELYLWEYSYGTCIVQILDDNKRIFKIIKIIHGKFSENLYYSLYLHYSELRPLTNLEKIKYL